MKSYIIAVSLFFAVEGIALGNRKSFLEEVYFYGDFGFGDYENLAKANNHIVNEMTPLGNRCVWLGGGMNYSHSIWNSEAFVQSIGGGQQDFSDYDSMGVLQSYAACEIYTGLKGGVKILPFDLPFQIIPELGYLYFQEELSKTNKEQRKIFYNEELKGFCITPGFSMCYRYSNAFISFSYFHNNVEEVKMDNYILELGGTLTGDSLLLAIQGGLATKTDGRQCYYIVFKMGLSGTVWKELIKKK